MMDFLSTVIFFGRRIVYFFFLQKTGDLDETSSSLNSFIYEGLDGGSKISIAQIFAP